MIRFFKIAESSRWDRKLPLSKEDAVTRLFTGKQPNKIANLRPSYFMAKPDTPYTPRKGSSLGKTSTRQIGARRVERDFRKMLESIFSIADSMEKYAKKKAKIPKISIQRFFSK